MHSHPHFPPQSIPGTPRSKIALEGGKLSMKVQYSTVVLYVLVRCTDTGRLFEVRRRVRQCDSARPWGYCTVVRTRVRHADLTSWARSKDKYYECATWLSTSLRSGTQKLGGQCRTQVEIEDGIPGTSQESVLHAGAMSGSCGRCLGRWRLRHRYEYTCFTGTVL